MECNTSQRTKETEMDYIKEINNDMILNDKHWYTNTYRFYDGHHVKITVEILNYKIIECCN